MLVIICIKLNIMNKYKVIFLLLFVFISVRASEILVIPRPNHIEIKKGYFNLSQKIEIKSNNVSNQELSLFKEYLKESKFSIINDEHNIVSSDKAFITLTLIDKKVESTISNEGYTLSIDKKQITIVATSESGLFYGLQTLFQIANNSNKNKINCAEIKDYPRFKYRGLHLDVSRHFFPISFIKKHLELMAYFKLNTFHWHLTDGPGWRLEIKKYPLLTQIGAFRTHENWQDWWDTKPRRYVDSRTNSRGYGGFYTQDEAREIVEFARKLNIIVIPEIEMPGHSEEVLALYPHLSCVNKPYEQSEFCIGNDSTFIFLKDVLTEVIDIFPSKYIHIGGDEADKSHWKKCPKCQKRIKDENLKNEEELQSYLIKRIEKFLISKNRKLLGWDEILEGGLAPEATVMSWRGEQGGIDAVKQGHDAIMTPGEFCYFDSYQSNPLTEPRAMGGFLPLEKVYGYNPISEKLLPHEQNKILGVQANVWTEYIPTEKHLEYMIYPRILALAEVAWTMPDNKNWEDFKKRVSTDIDWLQKQEINTFTLSDEVKIEHETDTINKGIRVSLFTEKYGYEIRYKIGEESPYFKMYLKPFLVKDSAIVITQLFKNKTPIGKPNKFRFDYHKGIGKKIYYTTPINKKYSANGEKTLLDAQRGGIAHGDGRWQGFVNTGIDVTIDLGKVTDVSSIRANFMQNKQAWIYYPKTIRILFSENNSDFEEVAIMKNTTSTDVAGIIFKDFEWKGNKKTRYIRYKVEPNDIKGGWVFLDEIVIW